MITAAVWSLYRSLSIHVLVSLLVGSMALAQPSCIGDGCPGSGVGELNVVGLACGVTYCSRQFSFPSQSSLGDIGFAYNPQSTTYTSQYKAYIGLYASGGDDGPKTLLVNRSVGVPFGHNPSLPNPSWAHGGDVTAAWYCWNGFGGVMLPANYYAACVQIECAGDAQGGGPMYRANSGSNPQSHTNQDGPPPINFTTFTTTSQGSFDVQAYYAGQIVGGFCTIHAGEKGEFMGMTWWQGLILLLVIGATIAGMVFAYRWYMQRSEYQPIDHTSH